METFTLALVQHASPVRKKAKNLATTIAWAKKAKEAGAKLVCFPELSLTGHAGDPAMVEEAEPVPGGPSVSALCEVAREWHLFIAAGVAEDDRSLHYNTQFIVGPEGYVGKQRKVHLSRDEYFYFRGGTDLPVLDLPFARVGIILCYDNQMPEMARCLAIKGAELLLCPHAARFGKWPGEDRERRQSVKAQKENWRLVHACRSYDNGVYVALCNTAGRSALGLRGVEANHAGGCMVFGPTGDLIAESRSQDITEEMVTVELEGQLIADLRKQSCFSLQTRRPEVFKAITEPTS